MHLTLLGTGSPIPDPMRAGPSTLVRSADSTILVDCGRGVLMRLAGAGVLPPMLSAVLVTHLHSDHLTDLNDVITTHWVLSPESVTLPVFGPSGMRGVVDATLGALSADIGYRLAHHADLTEPPSVEVNEVEPGDSFDLDGQGGPARTRAEGCGDGLFAAFDGPGRAVSCACAIRDATRPLGIEVRAGLHTGECEVINGKLGGVAVHIAARVAACAEPNEVLVSRTISDLVAGSGIQLTDRGAHALKGIPDSWQLYSAHV